MDLSEFHQVFFEECAEGLVILEQGLLALDSSADRDHVDSLFRAIHSMKGGAATFGFSDIERVAHLFETVLDEVRTGSRSIDRQGVDLLLEATDVLKTLAIQTQEKRELEPAEIAFLDSVLDDLSGIVGVTLSEEPDVAAESKRTELGWRISFTPASNLLRRGNDPLRIFRELAKLGDLETTADISSVSPLHQLDALTCQITWRLKLETQAPASEVSAVFEWVRDDCELIIEPITETSLAANNAPAPSDTVTTSALDAALGNKSDKSLPKALDTGTVRVSSAKVDKLVDQVGELIITQLMLEQIIEATPELQGRAGERLRDGFLALERNTRDLQESVLKVRMLPVGMTFSRLPRLVRDLSAKLGKRAEIVFEGERTEVDKSVLEKMVDPLVHLIRNALDHGIESPVERLRAGKGEMGRLKVAAWHESGSLLISVSDDGRGLDNDAILARAVERGLVAKDDILSASEIQQLLFMPGFSTASEVSDVSGRGVGLDVVRRNIRDLGGSLALDSRLGEGCEISVRLPVTLTIVDGQLVTVGGQVFVIPISAIIESIAITADMLETVTGTTELVRVRDSVMPLLRLDKMFDLPQQRDAIKDGLAVIVEYDKRRFSLLVDRMHGQQQVVIKRLDTNLHHISGISGATILGDGSVALIIDVPALIFGKLEALAISNMNGPNEQQSQVELA